MERIETFTRDEIREILAWLESDLVPVVFVRSTPMHNVGPARVNREMARTLVKYGIASIWKVGQ